MKRAWALLALIQCLIVAALVYHDTAVQHAAAALRVQNAALDQQVDRLVADANAQHDSDAAARDNALREQYARGLYSICVWQTGDTPMCLTWVGAALDHGWYEEPDDGWKWPLASSDRRKD